METPACLLQLNTVISKILQQGFSHYLLYNKLYHGLSYLWSSLQLYNPKSPTLQGILTLLIHTQQKSTEQEQILLTSNFH